MRIWDLGLEEARGYAGEHHLRGEAVQVGNAEAAGVSGNFRIVLLDREGDRSIAQHAEIVAIVRPGKMPARGIRISIRFRVKE